MKTVKLDGKYRRVNDKEANSLVSEGWSYCSKSEWKTEVRDKNKPAEKTPSNKRRKKRGKN